MQNNKIPNCRLTFLGKRRFFAPDKEKCEAFLRAQKNVVEQNTAEGASPNGVLRNPNRRKAVSVCRLLCDETAIANI
jgi:hypothetical protein